jgi:membrane associated rhomboid family serine protease
MYGRTGSRNGNANSLGAIPVTLTLLGLNVLTFLLAFLGMNAHLGESLQKVLALGADSLPLRPWSLLTWPLLGGLDLFTLLFSGFWAFSIGGSLERSWGWKGYLGFLGLCTALTGLTLWLGMRLLGTGMLVSGLWLAFGAPAFAWCQINRSATVLFSFVIPIPAPVLGWILLAMTFFGVSMMGGNPLLGLFALPAFGLAYYRVHGGKPSLTLAKRGGESRGRFTNFEPEGTKTPDWNPLAKLAEERKRKERDKKLAEMFKRSGYDDEGKP